MKYPSLNPFFVKQLLAATSFFAMSAGAHAASGTWTDTSGGLWSDVGNWSSGTIANGTGFTASFNTLDITADTTVSLDSSRTLSSLVFGDTTASSAAGWVLDNNGNAANILTLGTTPTITVNALGTDKNVTISAQLDGTAGLTKAGVGTLVLSGANTYTGTTNIAAGTLIIGVNAPSGGPGALGSATNVVQFGTGATINAASLLTGGAVTVGRAIDITAANAGTATLGGNTDNTSAFSGVIILRKNLTITQVATTGTNTLQFTGGFTSVTSGTKTLTFDNVGDVSVSGTAISNGTGGGSLALTKSNTGILTLNVANTYTGATSVSGGGKLLVNDTHIKTAGDAATTGYSVTGAGSTLGGTGRIAINANVTVGTGALLAPGASIGTLTLDGLNRTGDVLTMTTGSEFAYELAGNGSTADQLSFWNYTGGDLVLNNNEINLDLLGTLAPGTYNLDIFKFFSNAGTTATTHDFVDGLTIGSLGSNISAASIDWNGTGDNNNAIAVNFTVIPEPAAALLGGLSMLCLLRRRRN